MKSCQDFSISELPDDLSADTVGNVFDRRICPSKISFGSLSIGVFTVRRVGRGTE